MGTEVEISCTKCRVHRTESLSVGMSGWGNELRVCDTCGTLIIQEVNMLSDDKPPLEKCKKCGTEPRLLFPNDDGSYESTGSFGEPFTLGTHPQCGGELLATETGLMWD